MARFIFISVFLCCLISCIKQEDFDVENSFVYQPEFSLPIGRPEVLMQEFVDNINNLQLIPDSLISDTNTFLYNDNYFEIPSSITNTYVEEFSVIMLAEEISYIEKLMFRSNIVNRIPGEVETQIYFADSKMEYIDSMYPEGALIIPAANVDENGSVIEDVVLQEDVYFTKDEIQYLAQTSYIIFYTQLNIENINGILSKYYSTQDVEIQLGARVGLKIENQ